MSCHQVAEIHRNKNDQILREYAACANDLFRVSTNGQINYKKIMDSHSRGRGNEDKDTRLRRSNP